MHLIIDLPISSTRDPYGELWYGSSSPLVKKINVIKYFQIKKNNI